MGKTKILLWAVIVLLSSSTLISGVHLRVKIKTGTRVGAGTKANVRINVEGTTKSVNSVYLGNDFQNGDTKYRDVEFSVGRIKRITIYHDNRGLLPGWYLDYIQITDESTGLRYTFECDCWIKKGDKRQRNSKVL